MANNSDIRTELVEVEGVEVLQQTLVGDDTGFSLTYAVADSSGLVLSIVRNDVRGAFEPSPVGVLPDYEGLPGVALMRWYEGQREMLDANFFQVYATLNSPEYLAVADELSGIAGSLVLDFVEGEDLVSYLRLVTPEDRPRVGVLLSLGDVVEPGVSEGSVRERYQEVYLRNILGGVVSPPERVGVVYPDRVVSVDDRDVLLAFERVHDAELRAGVANGLFELEHGDGLLESYQQLI